MQEQIGQYDISKKDKSLALQIIETQSNGDEESFDFEEFEALALLSKNFNKIPKRMGRKSKTNHKALARGKLFSKSLKANKNKGIQ